LSYKNLAQIIKGYSLYSFNFIEAEDRFELYSKIIMEIKKAGPYTFFGYSAAGALMLELTKKLENKGLEVKDIIFLDCILTGKDRQKDAQEVNQRFAGKLEETLNKMGVGFLKDKILKKCSKYMAYEEGKTGLEIVNANIHLILSEETGKNHLSGNWDKFTTKKFSEYRGFGRHSEMLAPGFLEKNAHVIQEILKKIESE
jgi:tyrocidine synthetase-3